jgi:histidyl-tRNA synthetase
MANQYKAIRGMNDILPDFSHHYLWLEEQLKNWAAAYGYDNIRTPIVESTQLFSRSIGEITDVVEKEMYSFTDKLNGDMLSLRPEGTAGTVRAVIEHNLLYNNSCKLWYIGQMFRHERPQKGRYRQFHQLGIEALGFKDPAIDAEIILMQQDLWQRLGIEKHLSLEINCLGNAKERAAHREALIKYLEAHQDILDDEAKRRLYQNPLRILDSKNPELQEIINNAPRLIDYLQEQSLSHHKSWKNNLVEMNIKFTENHRLVRGLDYYNLSVFEWVTDKLGAQATVSGGGRYDPLIGMLGGKENYAIGFACGIERLLLLIDCVAGLPIKKLPEIFVASVGEATTIYAMQVANSLRAHGYSVVQNLVAASFKAQLKRADNLGVKLTLLIGENECTNRQVMVKLMDDKMQKLVSKDDLVAYIKRKL